MSDPQGPGGMRRRDGLDRPLIRRFYREVTVEAAPRKGDPAFRVLLDRRPVRTPKKTFLEVPTRALADALADEWRAQGERIDPQTMPLTKLANTVIDGVVGREAEVSGDILKYAATDLLCYRAEAPPELVERQAAAWDPLLAWAADALKAPLLTAAGILPVEQPRPALEAIAAALQGSDAFRLAALHVMTTLMGSVVLALAHDLGALSAERAWSLAHLDEDFQIAKWGEDAEAKARRAYRWREMQAASSLIHLLRTSDRQSD
ncbi:MAG TPA: ATP12 family protein [Hyphomicrobiaceae bacterium]|nr:ATP12 family protein [Hyphomicrobiaceae bacterium]